MGQHGTPIVGWLITPTISVEAQQDQRCLGKPSDPAHTPCPGGAGHDGRDEIARFLVHRQGVKDALAKHHWRTTLHGVYAPRGIARTWELVILRPGRTVCTRMRWRAYKELPERTADSPGYGDTSGYGDGARPIGGNREAKGSPRYPAVGRVVAESSGAYGRIAQATRVQIGDSSCAGQCPQTARRAVGKALGGRLPYSVRFGVHLPAGATDGARGRSAGQPRRADRNGDCQSSVRPRGWQTTTTPHPHPPHCRLAAADRPLSRTRSRQTTCRCASG